MAHCFSLFLHVSLVVVVTSSDISSGAVLKNVLFFPAGAVGRQTSESRSSSSSYVGQIVIADTGYLSSLQKLAYLIF